MFKSATVAGLASAALFSTLFFTGMPVQAQSVAHIDHPAEYPPVSFAGQQYIDSRGCAFTRSESGAEPEWTPRITRKGDLLCGFRPTRVAGAPSRPFPASRTLRDTQSEPLPERAISDVAETSGPESEPVETEAARPTSRVRAYAVSSRRGHLARGGDGRAEERARAVAGLPIPEGYEPVWKDGRLNPDRGKQRLSGALQTALIWTQTVPRRLVDTATGRDVTRKYRYLLYPYTDYGRQKRDLASGQHIIVTVRDQRMIVPRSALRTAPNGTTVISTKALSPTASVQPARRTVAPATPPARAGQRYVQAATFGVPANARATAARLQRAGLPVRVETVSRAGRTLQIVLAGPFVGAERMQAGLNAVRSAGFRDAFLRD